MEKMADGSPMLAPGTYVRVHIQAARDTAGQVVCPEETFIAKVVGTDMWRSKYELGRRYPQWDRWEFMDGGCWAFIGSVTEISEDEARAVPGRSA